VSGPSRSGNRLVRLAIMHAC